MSIPLPENLETRYRMFVARALIGEISCHGAVQADLFYPLAGDVYDKPVRAPKGLPLDSLTLGSPTIPRLILITMGGFLPADGTPLPRDAVPWLLPKVPSYVTGDNGEIVLPDDIPGTVVAEAELAVVIGKEIRRGTQDEARDAIFGFTIFNDVSMPEFLPAHDYFRSKSIDTFASMGPWIRTDVSEPEIERGLRIICRVNGKVRGTGNTNRFKFPPSAVVAFASQYTKLVPGDVISLGTPQDCRIQAGDFVELEVEGIGVLRNRVVDRTPL